MNDQDFDSKARRNNQNDLGMFDRYMIDCVEQSENENKPKRYNVRGTSKSLNKFY